MRRSFHHKYVWTLLLLIGLGLRESAVAQVPSHQERIRETARDILDQPEFGLFPRLKPGESARGLATPSGVGIPRLKSSTGRLPEPRNAGRPAGANQAGPRRQPGNGAGPERRQANRFPQDLPGEDPRRANGNPPNAEDALGREELFPEAGNLEGIENQDFRVNPQERPNPDDLNNRNPEANTPPKNGVGNQENLPGEIENPQQIGQNGNPPNEAGNDPAARNLREGGRPDHQNPNDALPAPRPRERTIAEQSEPASRRSAEMSGFARIVGTVFHVMAWTILAVICSLIIFLIGKAILELERPASLIPATANSRSALDLEPSRAPGDLPADVYVNQARKLAEQGLFREAVVQLLLGALSRVERAGWVRFRQGMTVRDYLRGVHQHRAAYEGLRSIIRVFEPLTFGRREPTREHFHQSLKGYESGFGLD